MTCRFAHDPSHVCANADGRTPPRPGTDCCFEARAQLADLLRARLAVDAVFAEADARDADYEARLTACERWAA